MIQHGFISFQVASVRVKFHLETYFSFLFCFFLFHISFVSRFSLLNLPRQQMQPATKSSSQPRSPTEAVHTALPAYKCGWLYKRGNYRSMNTLIIDGVLGEHIKTWRPRYFVLLHDGLLYGYRKPPVANDNQQEEPLNKFQVIDCSIIRQDKIKQNAFVIHFNQVKIERLFAASSHQDR